MIPFLDLTRQHAALRAELLGAVEGVLASSRFVLGPEGAALEGELAGRDRKSTRLNSSHIQKSRMPSSA